MGKYLFNSLKNTEILVNTSLASNQISNEEKHQYHEYDSDLS